MVWASWIVWTLASTQIHVGRHPGISSQHARAAAERACVPLSDYRFVRSVSLDMSRPFRDEYVVDVHVHRHDSRRASVSCTGRGRTLYDACVASVDKAVHRLELRRALAAF